MLQRPKSAAQALLWASGIVYLTNRITDGPAKQEGLEPEHGPEQPVPSDELVTSLFALVFVKGFGQLLSACSAVQHCTPMQFYVSCRIRRPGSAARTLWAAVGEDGLIERMFADYRIARPAEPPLELADAFEVRYHAVPDTAR